VRDAVRPSAALLSSRRVKPERPKQLEGAELFMTLRSPGRSTAKKRSRCRWISGRAQMRSRAPDLERLRFSRNAPDS